MKGWKKCVLQILVLEKIPVQYKKSLIQYPKSHTICCIALCTPDTGAIERVLCNMKRALYNIKTAIQYAILRTPDTDD